MKQDVRDRITDLLSKWQTLKDDIDLPTLQENYSQLEATTYATDFWSQPTAQKTMRDLSLLKERITTIEHLHTIAADIQTYQALAHIHVLTLNRS